MSSSRHVFGEKSAGFSIKHSLCWETTGGSLSTIHRWRAASRRPAPTARARCVRQRTPPTRGREQYGACTAAAGVSPPLVPPPWVRHRRSYRRMHRIDHVAKTSRPKKPHTTPMLSLCVHCVRGLCVSDCVCQGANATQCSRVHVKHLSRHALCVRCGHPKAIRLLTRPTAPLRQSTAAASCRP